jgi:O-antigen/teichoic acid export membrane protein
VTDSIRRSLALSFLEKYASLAIQIGSGLIVARLITPEAFGTFAIGYAIVGFAHVIREMGVGSYLIQLPELEDRHVRAALFTTGAVAWTLGLVLWLASPLVGRLYGEEVRGTTLILLLSFAVMPLSSTIMAVLQREMRFGALLRINLAGSAASAALAVALAAMGMGAAGLAWASVGGQLAIGLVGALHLPRRAHFVPSTRGAVTVLRFGSLVMANSLLHQCSTNIASLITARFVPIDAMGMFARAQSVTAMFDRLLMSGVGPLLLPLLAAQRRAGEDGAETLGRAFAYLAALTWPFFLFVSLEATPIVRLLFGEQWLPAADLLRLIALGGPFWLVGCLVPPLLTARGQLGLIVRVQVVAQVVAVLGVALAAPHGIAVIAAAAIPISAAHACLWLGALHRSSPGALVLLRRAVGPSLIVTLATVTPLGLLDSGRAALDPLLSVTFSGTAAALAWICAIRVVRHPINTEISRQVRDIYQAIIEIGASAPIIRRARSEG